MFLPQSAFCVVCPIQCAAGSCRKHTLLWWLMLVPPAPAAAPSGQAAVCHTTAARTTYSHKINTFSISFKMGLKYKCGESSPKNKNIIQNMYEVILFFGSDSAVLQSLTKNFFW